jgi:excinuclease ABC subunit C
VDSLSLAVRREDTVVAVAGAEPLPASVGAPGSTDQLAALRDHVRRGLAQRPGVYRMLAPDGEVLYVGKSRRLRARLLSYFRAAPEDKGARILRRTGRLEWEYTPSEFAALLLELRQIKRYRPRFNVVNKRDARHYAFIQVTRGPAPKLLVARRASGAGARLAYGPFLGPHRVAEAVRELNNALGLRDCAEDTPLSFSDQQELFSLGKKTPGCLRFEIKRCLGPCVGACSASEYRGRVALAQAFLEGADDGPLARFRHEMEAAGASLEFERAAAYRDRLRRLEDLRGQLDRLRVALSSLSFAYTLPGHEGEDRVYLIHRGSVRAEAEAPRTEEERGRLLQLADEIYAAKERADAPVLTHEIDEILLVAAWFRRFPEELQRTARLG